MFLCDVNGFFLSQLKLYVFLYFQQYAGRWRLIESYGSEFQGGTCNVVEYTLQSENSFNVINSQVVNENLESITATASVASNDGSGHLRLSFPNSKLIIGTKSDWYTF